MKYYNSIGITDKNFVTINQRISAKNNMRYTGEYYNLLKHFTSGMPRLYDFQAIILFYSNLKK